MRLYLRTSCRRVFAQVWFGKYRVVAFFAAIVTVFLVSNFVKVFSLTWDKADDVILSSSKKRSLHYPTVENPIQQKALEPNPLQQQIELDRNALQQKALEANPLHRQAEIDNITSKPLQVRSHPGNAAKTRLREKSIKTTATIRTTKNKDKDKYKLCAIRTDWLQDKWKTDAKFKAQGVDGTKYCIGRYLSEVENVCPRENGSDVQYISISNNLTIPFEETNINLGLDGLIHLLKDPGTRKVFDFVRKRVIRNWDRWKRAAVILASKQNLSRRIRKRILLYPGVMTEKAKLHFVENQFKGGPLGELVQWTDLITTLYILGHNLTIATEYEILLRRKQDLISVHPQCASTSTPFDLIYTDIIGLEHITDMMGHAYGDVKCMLRILDSFGTETPYNDAAFAKRHNKKSFWGQRDLHVKQFNTLYPHTPDNSFLGFVVERHGDEESLRKLPPKKNIALVYGKAIAMWKNIAPILDAVHKYTAVHGTVNRISSISIPKYVVNHGVLPGQKLHSLLKEIKIFLGIPKSPKEGPGPLEAIGYGAVYINPIFDPPLVFGNKPTSRTLPSVNPYTETHIGEPHVVTVNMSRPKDVEAAVKKILERNTFEPYLAYEFTHEGMLQRINAYLEHQNFCTKVFDKWPPKHAVKFELADSGESCQEYCWRKGRICELLYFEDINSLQALAQVSQCDSVNIKSDDFVYPYVETNNTTKCTVQENSQLFSCPGEKTDVRRFCPCRTYIKGQSALCGGCE